MGQLIAIKAEQEVTEIARPEMHRGWDMKRAMAAGAAMLEAVPAALGLSPVAAGVAAVGTAAAVGAASAPSRAQTVTLRQGLVESPLMAQNAGVGTQGSFNVPPYRNPLIGGVVNTDGALEGIRAVIVSTDNNAPSVPEWRFTAGVVSAFTGSSINTSSLTSVVANVTSARPLGSVGGTSFYDTVFSFSSAVPVTSGAFYGMLTGFFNGMDVQGVGFATGTVSPFSLQAPDARISTPVTPPYTNIYRTLSQMGTPTNTLAAEYTFRPASASSAAAPEPGSLALLGSLAIGGLAARRGRGKEK